MAIQNPHNGDNRLVPEHTLAVFIDFENLALGFDQGSGKGSHKFDIDLVLDRLVEKGKIVVKRAYCDWSRFAEYKRQLHESAVELIEIPKRSKVGKNSADIRLTVDAMDLAHQKAHVNTFVVVSGDSDFSPLVSKLKENGKYVIGLGMKDSTSDLLMENCDEFIFYEDLERPVAKPPRMPPNLPKKKLEAFNLLIDSILAVLRENKEVLYASMLKDTMKRKRPSFDETYHGYDTFSELLDDAEESGLIRLKTDPRSGTYVVVGFGGDRVGRDERER